MFKRGLSFELYELFQTSLLKFQGHHLLAEGPYYIKKKKNRFFCQQLFESFNLSKDFMS